MMASSYGIGNILTDVMRSMYQTEDNQSLPTGAREQLGPMLNMDLPDSTSWFQIDPQLWSNQHVLEWISYHVEKHKYDASNIDLSFCDMDGATLLTLTKNQLVSIFGPLGEELYKSHQDLSKNSFDLIPDDFSDIFLQSILPDDCNEYEFLDTKITWNELDNEELPDHCKTLPDFQPSDPGYESAPTSPYSIDDSNPGSQSPSSPDSGGSESDFDHSIMHGQYGIQNEDFPKVSTMDYKAPKRGRGRPRKLGKEERNCTETKRSKHSPRGTHLWEFIRDILLHPEINNGLLKWEDRSEGIFKFLKSEAVAQLWGEKKKNSSMTYEKLSRAMRYYYKREILERVDGRRLVYKFGKNSSGWRVGDA